MEKQLEKVIIDESPVFQLAKTNPVFIINDRLYYGKTKSEIKEGPKVEVLERMALKSIYTGHRSEVNEFLKSQTRTKSNEGKSSYKDNLAQFAMSEIFPYLRKEEDSKKIAEVLGVESGEEKAPCQTSEEKEDIKKYVQEIISSFKAGKINFRNLRIDSVLGSGKPSRGQIAESCLSRVSDGYDWGIYGDNFYGLNIVTGNGDLKIGGRSFNLSKPQLLGVAKEKYARKFLELILEKSLESFVLEKGICLKPKSKGTRMQEYHEGDFGFKKRGRELIVYVDVPSHVLRTPGTDNYYRFSAHKLGIIIGLCDGKPILEHNPFPLVNTAGPFYGNSYLCMGDYSTGYFSRMKPGKSFAKLLIDARNVVLRGYTSRCNPISTLGCFENRRVSLSTVKNNGWQVTNQLGRRYDN
jgi:hypothetical protein